MANTAYKSILSRPKGFRLYIGVEVDYSKSKSFKKLTAWVVKNNLFLDTFNNYSTYTKHDKALVGYQIYGQPLGKSLSQKQLTDLVNILDLLTNEIPEDYYVLEFYEGGVLW